jgi:putative glycosyltransferase (TIGR04372 family)
MLIKKIKKVPHFILAFFAVILIRLISPWILVRFEGLVSNRIGHFVGNTEMYLCEREANINTPVQKYFDIFYISEPVSNQQLAVMWKRVLHIWPAWIVIPIIRLNRLFPGGGCHEVGQNTQTALDVHNLLDRLPPHLKFTSEEETRGEVGLQDMGLPIGAKFVCLNVRDSAYLSTHFPSTDFSYHNYRDSDIQNYITASEELADRGFFVIRMGAKVKNPMNSSHPKVIDYATNGMRNDFMDIYLGAKCTFCITTGTGWDGIPEMMRRPIVYVNLVPIGCLHTFSAGFISITKKHIWQASQKSLTLSEIFANDVGFSMSASDFESKGVGLIENTPEEIRDVAVEMADRLANIWQLQEGDEVLQRRFWDLFSSNAVDAFAGNPLHGEIRSRFGACFLRNNPEWLK